jgi:hypothetical protein
VASSLLCIVIVSPADARCNERLTVSPKNHVNHNAWSFPLREGPLAKLLKDD